jgi:hypothetical protein
MAVVLIAGAGIAAGSAALRLLQLDFIPHLLAVDRREISGVEMLPAATHPLLETLGLGAVLAALRPTRATGLLQRWGTGDELRPGRALHVDRLALRDAVLAEAVRRGAVVERVARLPPRPIPIQNGVRCGERRVFAALDATGRRAAWSQPTVKYGRMQADLFAGALAEPPHGGVVARLASGWAYCAAYGGIATIGVVAPPRPRADHGTAEAIAVLGVTPAGALTYLGRRPAFPQAAVKPIKERVLAIGDAAFAHDPIGGRGISFALGSAFAAAATLRSWRDHPEQRAVARLYYRRYVAAEQSKHLAFLRQFYAAPRERPSLELPASLRWRGRIIRSAMAFADGITAGDAVELPDGGEARWLGRFDLLRLSHICARALPSSTVLALLEKDGLAAEQARSLLIWALEKQLIARA